MKKIVFHDFSKWHHLLALVVVGALGLTGFLYLLNQVETTGSTEPMDTVLVTENTTPGRWNPLTQKNVSEDFLLTEATPASNDVLDCFATDLADLEADFAWRSTAGSEGNVCNLVYQMPDMTGQEIAVIKEYLIPGSFQIIRTPYITGLFGARELKEGDVYHFPTRRQYSDDDIILGGTLGDTTSLAVDQFGQAARDTNVRVTVYDVSRSWSGNESCISFGAHYSSLTLPYGFYEHVWCPIENEKWQLVDRILIPADVNL